MKTEIIQQVEATGKQLLQTISAFKPEQINAVPFEGSWTPGQVTNHILKSASGCLAVINGQTKPTERDAKEHIKTLKEIFLNFNIKMQSPDFVRPSNEPQNLGVLTSELEKTFTGISTTMQAKDNTETCLDFPMPQLGELTRAEWVWFSIFHTQRHINQLKNIFLVLNKHQ